MKKTKILIGIFICAVLFGFGLAYLLPVLALGVLIYLAGRYNDE